MNRLRILLLLLLSLLAALTGCGSGAVVFAPTPAPPDLSPVRYVHPTGAFTLDVPRTWSMYTRSYTNLATAAFSPPGAARPALVAAVVNTGQATSLPALINRYQTEIRPDAGRYTEQDRQAMGDGSWRFTGVRQVTGGALEAVNTFIVQAGSALGVLDIVLPGDDPDRFDALERIANTFTVAGDAPLEAAGLDPLALVTPGDVVVANLSSWVTDAGVFFVTGEIRNNTPYPLADIPVRVQIFDESGDGLGEARDVVMGHAVLPGGFGPFSLRFGQGQPPDARTFRVLVGGDGWAPTTDSAPQIIGGEALTWREEWSLTDDNQLLIEGSVTNAGTLPAVAPLATITAFDADNRIIATGFRQINAETIAPGDTQPYTLILPELGGIPAAVLVNIQALPGNQ